MPDTRPGIVFHEDGVCSPCKNYEKQKHIDWDIRHHELEQLCSKYRGKYKNGYDCAIAVSGGKDSYFQVYYMKEVMGMNPVLLSVQNIEWTETGRKNLLNLSDVFNCDLISTIPNVNLTRRMMRKAFIEIGSPTWYIDSLIYAYPYKMAMQLGLHLLVYGENINYTYGGEHNKETSSAMLQPLNDVVKPIWKRWLKDGDITEKELESSKQPSLEKCYENKLDPIYLSYFTFWDSHYNYKLAKRWGFQHLSHEYVREGTFEQYDQIDSISYLINPYLKYPKFGHASATDYASKWIRYGLSTREEMIPFVNKHDGILDQGVVEKFCNFISMSPNCFWNIMDKWYNTNLFKQDKNGVWTPKFKVGEGLLGEKV